MENGFVLEYHNHTTLQPIGLFSLFILIFIILICKKEKLPLAFFILACFIPPAQRIVVSGMDFNFLRILVLAGILRIILKNEFKQFHFTTLDKIIVFWAIIQLFIYPIKHGGVSGILNRIGMLIESVGLYFIFRIVINDKDDIIRIIHYMLILTIPVTIFFIFEKSTGRNIFNIFGGVPEYTMIREGSLRVQGAFAHPILAGCFWGALFPYFLIGLNNTKIPKPLCYLGIFNTLIMIILSSSSTPFLSLFFGLIGWFYYKFRNKLKELRIAIVLTIVGLNIVMKAPVYHLISRIDISGGSTGWHRYHLIDQALKNSREWILFGVSNIDHWNVFANDVTNQYIVEAISTGIIGLIVFIAIIVISFSFIGKLWRIELTEKKYNHQFSWMIGISLLMHIINFIAVSYFGQIWILWYMQLAISASLLDNYKTVAYKNQLSRTSFSNESNT